MMKVLITGTAGFILSNLIRKILHERKDIKLISIDKLIRPSAVNNIYFNRDHSFFIGDIADEHFIDRVFAIEKPDTIIHGAALTFVDDAIKNPNPFINSNVLGTQVLINAAIKYNVQKFIYCSTDEVYGHLKDENEKAWTESAPSNPRNFYSASKVAGEMIVKAAGETFGLNYCITRSSNNYGPRQTPEKFIPKIIKCILNNHKIPVYSKGENIRDWLHVYDNCAAILKILDEGQSGEIYNIGASQEFSNIEIVNIICKEMNYNINNIEWISDRPGHDFRYALNSDKIKLLEWEPKIKFRDGIIKTIEWYKTNKFYLND